MRARTKLTLAVGVGTLAIELGLIFILLSVFGEGLRFIVDHEANTGTTEKWIMIAALVAGLVLLLLVYNKVSDYLRSKMCWALVRHFHEKR